MPATPSGCRSMRARPGCRCSGVADALVPHPAREVRLRVRDFRGDDVQLGEARLVFRPVAEIAVHRGGEPRFVLGDQRLEPREPVDARAQVGIAFARERGALQREEPVEVGAVHLARAGTRGRRHRYHRGAQVLHQPLEFRRVENDLAGRGAQPVDRLVAQHERRRQVVQVIEFRRVVERLERHVDRIDLDVGHVGDLLQSAARADGEALCFRAPAAESSSARRCPSAVRPPRTNCGRSGRPSP